MPEDQGFLPAVGSALLAGPRFVGDIIAGPDSPNVDARERARRIVLGLLIGGNNPGALPQLHQYFAAQDAAQAAQAGEPAVRLFLNQRQREVPARQAWGEAQQRFPGLQGFRPLFEPVASGEPAAGQGGARETIVLPPSTIDTLGMRLDEADATAQRYRAMGRRAHIQVDSTGKLGITVDDDTNRIIMPVESFLDRQLYKSGYDAIRTEHPGIVELRRPPDVRQQAEEAVMRHEMTLYEETGDPSYVRNPDLRRRLGLDAITQTPGGAPLVPGAPPAPRHSAMPGPQEQPARRYNPASAMERRIEEQIQTSKGLLGARAEAKQQADARERQDNVAFVHNLLQPLRDLIPKLPAESYPNTFWGRWDSAKRRLITVPLAEFSGLHGDADIIDMVNHAGMVATLLGRKFGERGVFTNQDFARFVKPLMIAYRSREQARRQLDNVERAMIAVASRNMDAAAGRPITLAKGEYLMTPAQFTADAVARLGADPDAVNQLVEKYIGVVDPYGANTNPRVSPEGNTLPSDPRALSDDYLLDQYRRESAK